MSRRIDKTNVLVSNTVITLAIVSLLIGTLTSLFGIHEQIRKYDSAHHSIAQVQLARRQAHTMMRKNLVQFNYGLTALVETANQFRELSIEYEALHPYIYDNMATTIFREALEDILSPKAIKLDSMVASPGELNFELQTVDEESLLRSFNEVQAKYKRLSIWIDQVTYLNSENGRLSLISGRMLDNQYKGE